MTCKSLALLFTFYFGLTCVMTIGVAGVVKVMEHAIGEITYHVELEM
jgi:hypothetical protein